MKIEKVKKEELQNCQLVYVQCVYMDNGEIVCNGKGVFIPGIKDYIYKELN